MSSLQNLSIKDLVDAFTGATETAREALPGRNQVLRALGAQPAGDTLTSSVGILAAGIVLGAGLAVLFAPRSGAEVREAIGEKIGETMNGLRATGTPPNTEPQATSNQPGSLSV